MYKCLALILSMNILAASAAPSCLVTNECMEYDGQIIDLRSDISRSYQALSKCDPLVENCLGRSAVTHEMPTLSSNELSKLLGNERAEYFIPIDVRKKDLAILAGALSLGTVVFANDRAIMDFVQDNRNEHTETIGSIGDFAGGRIGMASLMAGSYFIGAVMDNGKLKQIGLIGVGAGLATQIVTTAFKKTFDRTRPNGTDDPYDFFADGQSFFSGHASAAFSLATVVAEVYKDKPMVPYIAYGAATLVAYSRVHDNKHWASDVIVGAVAGHLITKIIMRTLERTDRSTSSGLIIIPQAGIDELGRPTYGVQVQWTPGKKASSLRCKRSGLEGSELIRLCLSEAFERSAR